jgi:hypothetical protein
LVFLSISGSYYPSVASASSLSALRSSSLPSRKLSLRKRFLALTSNEDVYVRSLEKRLFKLLTGLKQLYLSKQCKSHGISLAKAIAEEILRVSQPGYTKYPSAKRFKTPCTEGIFKPPLSELETPLIDITIFCRC